MAGGPLNGVRVLEFSIILSAPFAGLHLSDMGADVIKVEQPPLGDSMRDILPGGIPGQSKFFQVLNRGRRGLSVDLATERGKELIYRLVPSTDVVLINYRPGVAERLGVDYETLRRYRDDLIYADISGYGFEGPLRDHAASDIAASAYGGAIAFTDAYEEDGAPRANYPPLAGDTPTGLATAMGIVAALFHRERTGEGQAVRSSLLRSVMMMTCYLNNTDPVADPGGRDIARAALSRVREQGGSYQELVEARRLATAEPLLHHLPDTGRRALPRRADPAQPRGDPHGARPRRRRPGRPQLRSRHGAGAGDADALQGGDPRAAAHAHGRGVDRAASCGRRAGLARELPRGACPTIRRPGSTTWRSSTRCRAARCRWRRWSSSPARRPSGGPPPRSAPTTRSWRARPGSRPRRSRS